MALSPSGPELSHGSRYLENKTDQDQSNGSFSFTDIFSSDKTEGEGMVGLPPLSGDSQNTVSENISAMAPPLALDNHQNFYNSTNSSDNTKDFPSTSASINRASLSLEEAIAPTDENSATFRVAFGEAINNRIEGVARAIKEAQSKAPELEIEDSQKSNKLAWNESKTPIESLFNLRTNEKSTPMPRELFATSQKPLEEADSTSRASIGLEDSTNLPNYKDHQYGRLREFTSVSDSEFEQPETGNFERLSGSPQDYLNGHKVNQAKRFSDSETRHTRTTMGDKVGTSVIAKDFSSLETRFGEEGQVSSNEYDSYRRPLSRLDETYGQDGSHTFELTQYSYENGEKVKPFADYTRVIKFADNKASVEIFDNRGIKPQLISENSWS